MKRLAMFVAGVLLAVSGEALSEEGTSCLTGEKQPISITLTADGKTWRLCGLEPQSFPALPQTGVRVMPLQTHYAFAGDGLKANLVFSTAKTGGDLDVFSRPLTYVTVRVEGAKEWNIDTSIPTALAKKDGEVHFLLAYDDVKAIQFFGDNLPAWWRRDGLSFTAMLEKAEAECPAILKLLDAFDAELYADFMKVGGEEYANRACRAYRQAFASCKLVADRNNQPICLAADAHGEQFALALLVSPTLARAMLAPILLSAKESPDAVSAKSVRETIIRLAALAQAEDSAEFASYWWPILTQWAANLEKSVEKSDASLVCYGRLAGMLGKEDIAAKYVAAANGGDPEWTDAVKGSVFMPMLCDKAMWSKYASRDKAKTGVYAPLKITDVENAAAAFNLASFNIRCPSPSDKGNHFWTNRFPYVVKVINDRRFDIVGMQELAPKQRNYLDEALGDGWGRIGIGRLPEDKGESMTIYYRKDRFECLATDTFWLSETPRVPGSRSWGTSCPRNCTWGLFRDRRTGCTFRYYNTHLDHISNEARVKGMRVLLAEMRRLSQGETVFLTGDMNAHYKNVPEADRVRLEAGGGPVIDDPETIGDPISAALHALYDTRLRCETPHEGPLFTFSGYRTSNGCLIDFVFATGNVRVLRHVTCHERPDGMHPSDHDAVMARLLIK